MPVFVSFLIFLLLANSMSTLCIPLLPPPHFSELQIDPGLLQELSIELSAGSILFCLSSLHHID